MSKFGEFFDRVRKISLIILSLSSSIIPIYHFYLQFYTILMWFHNQVCVFLNLTTQHNLTWFWYVISIFFWGDLILEFSIDLSKQKRMRLGDRVLCGGGVGVGGWAHMGKLHQLWQMEKNLPILYESQHDCILWNYNKTFFFIILCLLHKDYDHPQRDPLLNGTETLWWLLSWFFYYFAHYTSQYHQ